MHTKYCNFKTKQDIIILDNDRSQQQLSHWKQCNTTAADSNRQQTADSNQSNISRLFKQYKLSNSQTVKQFFSSRSQLDIWNQETIILNIITLTLTLTLTAQKHQYPNENFEKAIINFKNHWICKQNDWITN